MPDGAPDRGAARIRLWAGVAILAWSALIWAASTFPTPPRLPSGVSDKALHFVAFFVHGALSRAVVGPIAAAGTSALSISAGWGAIDEFHQSFVPGRDASLGDWIADLLGAGSGVAAVSLLTNRRNRG